MSRLQKKKPAGEKKKKKADPDKTLVAGQVAASPKQPKPALATGAQKGKPEKKTPGQTKETEGNFFHKALEFLREVKVELKKVTWPTRKQTTGTTIVVIIFVFVVAVFLGVFDYSLSKLVQIVLT